MSRDFRPPVFFSWFEPLWASDKQAKVFLSSVLITPRYSNLLISSAVGIPPQSQNRNLWESLVAFKGTIKRIPFRGKLSCKKRVEESFVELLRLKFWFRGVMHTAESNFSIFKAATYCPKNLILRPKSWACYGFSRYVRTTVYSMLMFVPDILYSG